MQPIHAALSAAFEGTTTPRCIGAMMPSYTAKQHVLQCRATKSDTQKQTVWNEVAKNEMVETVDLQHPQRQTAGTPPGV